jgi:hypothetical protein
MCQPLGANRYGKSATKQSNHCKSVFYCHCPEYPKTEMRRCFLSGLVVHVIVLCVTQQMYL